MKIGIDASRYGHLESTGVELYGKHLIDGLVASLSEKDDVRLVLYGRQKNAFPFPVGGKVEEKIVKPRRLWTLLGLSLEMLFRKPDVLFVPSHVFPFFVPKKSIITIHDTAFRYLKHVYSWREYWYLNWSTKFAVKKASKIIVPSSATANDLQHFFGCDPEKIVIVPHGFEAPGFSKSELKETLEESKIFRHFNIDEESEFFFFVGRLESKKNLMRLIQAFAKICETHPKVRLILAGKRGVGFDHILQTVKENKLEERVIMPGYITEKEKCLLYAMSKAFVFPSLYEGFGLPLLEAFYFKTPVLTSHIACLPEVAGEAACYCDPYDLESIAMGMDKLLNNRVYAEELVAAGSEQLKKFSWKTTVKKTLEVLYG